MSRNHRRAALAVALLGLAVRAVPLLAQEPLPPPGMPSVGATMPPPVAKPRPVLTPGQQPVLQPVLEPGLTPGTVPVVIPTKEFEPKDIRTKGAAPANLTAVATGPFAVEINWQDVPGAIGYKVYRLIQGGVPVVRDVAPLSSAKLPLEGRRPTAVLKEAGRTPATSARFTDSGLLPATTFSYVVESVYPDTIIPGKTPPVSVTMPGAPPVTGLTAKATGIKTPEQDGYRVELTWGPAPGAARYMISQFQNMPPIATVSAAQSAADQPPATYSYIDDRHFGPDLKDRIIGQEKYIFGVSPASYYYQVLPVYVLGSMELVADKATAPGVAVQIPSQVVDARPPGTAPAGVTAVASGIQSVVVKWNEVPWSTGYRVYSSAAATGPFLGEYSLALPTPRTIAPQSYIDGWLVPGSTTYYKVEAFYADSSPGASQVVSATTPIPPPLAGLVGKGYALSAELSWNASAGASAYYVYRDGKKVAQLLGQSSYLGSSGPQTTYSEQVPPGTYTYKVLPVYTWNPNESLDLLRQPSVTVTVNFPTIKGFADTHTHPFANLAAGGRLFWGAAFGPIQAALALCNPWHGEGGLADWLGNIKAGFRIGHHTGGYPNFDGWPTWNTLDHQQMYSDWILRAYEGGLRLMVAHAVNNSLICSVINKAPDRSCDDMEAVDLQIQAAEQMQAYIDAERGGPGKGWFRIAYTPQQARQIIMDGKLAVVLGIEVDKLFGCGIGECDAATVDAKLAQYYNKGIRHLYPVHFADNAFGGYALGGGTEKLLFGANSMAASKGGLLAGTAPTEENCSSRFAQSCNQRGLTALGGHLITSMMNKGMIIDIDHMGMHTTDGVLALTSPRHYPVLSGHTGFVGTAMPGHSSERDKSDGWLAAMKTDGGMVSVGLTAGEALSYTPSWRAPIANNCNGTSKTFAQGYLYAVDKMGGPDVAAVGLATDQFLNELTGPRFDNHCPGQDPATKVTYPFTARTGASLGKSHSGNRDFDYNLEGLAHFGLLPDLIQDLKNNGMTDRDLDPLFRSAEGYIRVWERAVASVPVP